MPLQSQHGQARGYGGTSYRDPTEYDQPPSKRLRPSEELARRAAYEQSQRSSHRATIQLQQQEPYTQYARDLGAPIRTSAYFQGQPAAPAFGSEYSFGHQRNSSSSASSPFISPRTEYPGYPYSTPNTSYQQPPRDNYQHQYNQYPSSQLRQAPQLMQPVPPERQLPSSLPLQSSASRSYAPSYGAESGASRSYAPSYEAEEKTSTEAKYMEGRQSSRSNYQPQAYTTGYERLEHPVTRTLPPPANSLPTQSLPSVLPSLQSTLNYSPQRLETPQLGSSSAYSSGGANTNQTSSGVPEGTGYGRGTYRGRENG